MHVLHFSCAGTMQHNDRDDGNVYGPASPTHLTHPEQVTVMTLWCMMRAPLFFGGRVPLDNGDTWTLDLLTNAEVLAVHNASDRTRVVNATSGSGSHYAFAADATSDVADVTYLAIFNTGDVRNNVTLPVASIGITASPQYCARDLWAHAAVAGTWTSADIFTLPVDGHGAAILAWRAC